VTAVAVGHVCISVVCEVSAGYDGAENVVDPKEEDSHADRVTQARQTGVSQY